ncbi:MAG: hypothetical protein ACRD8Z_21120 [Nitrososphaeraceae archaeon]
MEDVTQKRTKQKLAVLLSRDLDMDEKVLIGFISACFLSPMSSEGYELFCAGRLVVLCATSRSVPDDSYFCVLRVVLRRTTRSFVCYELFYSGQLVVLCATSRSVPDDS